MPVIRGDGLFGRSSSHFGALLISLTLGAAAYSALSLETLAQTPGAVPQPQTAPPQPKSEPPPLPEKGATPATVLDDKDVEGILGKEIYSASGEDMGRIVDVVVDRNGQTLAAIIDFGGFLGVGSRKIAVDWHAFQFSTNGKLDRIITPLTRDEVRVAPEYKQGEPVVVLGPSTTVPSPSPQKAPAPAAAPTK